MSRRKKTGFLKSKKAGYFALAVAAVVAGLFFFLDKNKVPDILPTIKNQAGYKMEDRRKLEQLIHQGTNND